MKSLEIQFRDQNDNVLRLSDGLPSMVKLHAKETTMDQFCIHVSSKDQYSSGQCTKSFQK